MILSLLIITHAHAGAGSWANKHDYQNLLSRQQVIDSSGESYWQNTVNNIAWIKVAFANLARIFHRIALFLTYHIDIKGEYGDVENVHFVTKFACEFLEKFQRSLA